MNEKISIIMPAYNSEKYIVEAIESVIFQTFSEWELLIINDGSTDNTGFIIDSFTRKDDRIRVLHTDNKGVSHARNLGLDNVTGKWVMFLDSDDTLINNSLERLLSVSKEKDLVIGNYCEFPNVKEKKFLEDSNNVEKKDLINMPLLIGAVWGMIFRRDSIKEYFLCDLQYGEDTVFLYAQLRHCASIATISDIVYMYRRENENSLSRKKENMKLFYLDSLCSHIKEILGNSSVTTYYAYAVHYYLGYILVMNQMPQLTKQEKLNRVKEVLNNKYFSEIPLIQLKLKPKEMHLFTLLKIGDMALIEKGFGIE